MHRHVAAIGLAVGLASALGTALAAVAPTRAPGAASDVGPRSASDTVPTSAEVLAGLPDGLEKRRFVLDCTGCHQMDAVRTHPGGRARTEAEWTAIVERMLRYAGPRTPFPVISTESDPARLGAWLARHLGPDALPAAGGAAANAAAAPVAGAEVREYLLPAPNDLPHDVQVLGDGRVLVTGMMTHRMYVLDPGSGAVETVAIPVPQANPRAVELAPNGDWWVLLGAAHKVAHHRPATGEWRTFEIGMYGHSIGVDSAGGVWFDGHFTRDPALIGRVDAATGAVATHALPRHPTMAAEPGGPIPYELRIGPDGRVWTSELQGNRILSYDPRAGAFATYDMPTPASGPRRFDLDAAGRLWIPAYSANALVRLEPDAPPAGRFREFPLPIRDAVPYVARVDHATGHVWLGTSAADAVLVFDPRSERFATVPLPSRGALVRHLAVDAARREVWVAYGASPGIPARVARIRVPASPIGR